METLQFQPLQSIVEQQFWGELGDLKLHKLKLQEGPLPITAQYTVNNRTELPGYLSVDPKSLLPAAIAAAAVPGSVGGAARPSQGPSRTALTTVEVASRIWDAIESGEAERSPQDLQRLVLLAYCDLKHYKYHYWFAFPALKPPSAFTAAPAVSLAVHFGSTADQVLAACSAFTADHPGHPCWLVSVSSSLADGSGSVGDPPVAAVPLAVWQQLQAQQRLRQPHEAGELQQQGERADVCLAVVDCGNLPEHPAWPLRNVLLMAAARWRVEKLTVLCLRQRKGLFDGQASIVLRVALPELPAEYSPEAVGGWELNKHNKQGPRMADLGASFDPQRLASSAVDLNLSLMRWRAAPALDVGRIGATKCLLLGAGTLGCSVARTLLGWGVRHVTFVDNSRVAYSNPVRQSLYNFEDCLGGGKPKAQAAADALRCIFPGVTADGIALSIPMPGHPIAEAELDKVKADIARLEALVTHHDVIFLLTDTRESRWLPTLLAAAAGKLAINSALGFDGFMVMRHGAPPLTPAPLAASPAVPAVAGAEEGTRQASGLRGQPLEQEQQQQQQQTEEGEEEVDVMVSGQGYGGAVEGPQHGQQEAAVRGAGQGPRLGCYFCNDVVAPVNSTVDRTLDQQCTVARPGLSSIAGALAVELMAATLAHPMGLYAPAAGTPASSQVAEQHELPLGEVPHMIRGQLGGFSQMCLSGQAFRQCTACSEAVVARYREEGHAFLLQGLADPGFLEDLTGLTELHRASEALLAVSANRWEQVPQVVEGWDSEGEAAGGAGQEEGALSGNEGDGDGWEEL
ncbi:hypothetical protein N2152v2_002380 [Parachlorella kessleri]